MGWPCDTAVPGEIGTDAYGQGDSSGGVCVPHKRSRLWLGTPSPAPVPANGAAADGCPSCAERSPSPYTAQSGVPTPLSALRGMPRRSVPVSRAASPCSGPRPLGTGPRPEASVWWSLCHFNQSGLMTTSGPVCPIEGVSFPTVLQMFGYLS